MAPGMGRSPWAGGGCRCSGVRTPYNIGIATGASRLVVIIDLDKPKPGQVPPPEWALPGITDGADVLAALCERQGWPANCIVIWVTPEQG